MSGGTARPMWLALGASKKLNAGGRRLWPGSRSCVCLGLDLIQLGVPAAPRHQLVVTADLRDACAVEHDDEVSHPDRAEPVGDEDGDASVIAGLPSSARVALKQLMLGLGVERGGRLVQRHDE